MKRIMKRLGPLLLSLILCVGTIIPLTGAGINKIFTITLMADKSTVTIEAMMDSGITALSAENTTDDGATDTFAEDTTADSTANTSVEDAADGDVEDTRFDAMLAAAEKCLGIRYVWGGAAPSTGFDCSGFVSWVLNRSGWDVGRLGAQALHDICVSISQLDAKPGDLVFFWHTYNAPNPNGVTHVGIYTGDGTFIHCGSSTGVTYSKLSNSYWRQHYYGMGRIPLQYLSDGGAVDA